MEHDEIFREIRGNNGCEDCGDAEEQTGPQTDRFREYPLKVGFQQEQDDDAESHKKQAAAADGERVSEESADILHMGDFPLIEKFP